VFVVKNFRESQTHVTEAAKSTVVTEPARDICI